MFDENEIKALCLIDLDTVMPGSVLYDYGDALRTGASTAEEDESNLDLVHVDFNLFKKFTQGFLEEAKNILNEEEIKHLLYGYYILTFECGMRFLADYLDGDKYFRVKYDTHNLVRARNQFKLVKEIEENWDKLEKIIKEIINNL
jgi:hypothetical protein